MRKREAAVHGLQERGVRVGEAGRLLVAEAHPGISICPHCVLQEALALGIGERREKRVVLYTRSALLCAAVLQPIDGQRADERGPQQPLGAGGHHAQGDVAAVGLPYDGEFAVRGDFVHDRERFLEDGIA